jgi:hypothetical protein
LIEDGSMQPNLWGINLYPAEQGDVWIEFDSMINVRPWPTSTRGCHITLVRRTGALHRWSAPLPQKSMSSPQKRPIPSC